MDRDALIISSVRVLAVDIAIADDAGPVIGHDGAMGTQYLAAAEMKNGRLSIVVFGWLLNDAILYHAIDRVFSDGIHVGMRASGCKDEAFVCERLGSKIYCSDSCEAD